MLFVAWEECFAILSLWNLCLLCQISLFSSFAFKCLRASFKTKSHDVRECLKRSGLVISKTNEERLKVANTVIANTAASLSAARNECSDDALNHSNTVHDVHNVSEASSTLCRINLKTQLWEWNGTNVFASTHEKMFCVHTRAFLGVLSGCLHIIGSFSSKRFFLVMLESSHHLLKTTTSLTKLSHHALVLPGRILKLLFL